MSTFAYVLERSLGEKTNGDFIANTYAKESQDLQINQAKILHKQGMNVWHMDLDNAEDRYLLVGTGMASLHIYDIGELDDPSCVSSEVKPMCSIKPLPSTNKKAAQYYQDAPGHTSGITCVNWYPIDNGMFATSSLDTTIKVWDANELEIASAFLLQDPVHIAAFSPVVSGSTAHLIAVGTDRPEVRLCDISIGASTHQLMGHRASIRSLTWSKTNEYQLVSGATDGSIRVWDIRRSGATACLMCLNIDGPAELPRRDTQGVSMLKKRKTGHDPHVAASTSSVIAHTKEVQSLAYTPDGRYIVSSGADHAVRVWNSKSGHNMFHHYEDIKCPGPRHITVAMAQEGNSDSTMLYHPIGTRGMIASYCLLDENTTLPRTNYTGHYSRVTSCIYRQSTRELISGGEDGLIAMWSPKTQPLFPSEETTETTNEPSATDGDDWSDEEEDAPNDRFIPPILQRE
ncbi:DNA excision repair ERCC-8 [Thraustotheca clavata]|uniref:DNA excision repair ERCC-8 n=1 Tax=Thraustotheca clavata TaxID=74557 RepID=A0A1W0A4H1_9STRA|nr:DNA excision repair ERCC-8 [Thraustotheca clavata]